MQDFPFYVVDLTHNLHENIPSWEGGNCFLQTQEEDYQEHGFRIQKIEMQAGVGTHIDAPAHRIPGALCVGEIDIHSLIAPCIVIDVSKKTDAQYKVLLEDIYTFEKQYGDLNQGVFVCIYTGWDRFWNNPEQYRNNLVFPSVSKEVIEYLLLKDIVGIGIDTLSPDLSSDDFIVHKKVLGAGKYIVENIANLEKIPRIGAYSMVMPIKTSNGTEAPVRLIALVPSEKARTP